MQLQVPPPRPPSSAPIIHTQVHNPHTGCALLQVLMISSRTALMFDLQNKPHPAPHARFGLAVYYGSAPPLARAQRKTYSISMLKYTISQILPSDPPT